MEVYTRIIGGGFCTIGNTFLGLPRIRAVVVPYEGLYWHAGPISMETISS